MTQDMDLHTIRESLEYCQSAMDFLSRKKESLKAKEKERLARDKILGDEFYTHLKSSARVKSYLIEKGEKIRIYKDLICHKLPTGNDLSLAFSFRHQDSFTEPHIQPLEPYQEAVMVCYKDFASYLQKIDSTTWQFDKYIFELSPMQNATYYFHNVRFPKENYKIYGFKREGTQIIEHRELLPQTLDLAHFDTDSCVKVVANSFEEATQKAIKAGLDISYLSPYSEYNVVLIEHEDKQRQFRLFSKDDEGKAFLHNKPLCYEVNRQEHLISLRLNLLYDVRHNLDIAYRIKKAFGIDFDQLLNDIESGRITFVWDDDYFRNEKLFRFAKENFKQTKEYKAYLSWTMEFENE
ncbi:hypothetical protein CQA49_06765 [Helicobacter sp. MIT 00-7814]|uniref:hypothetical protein n=1 Tax=unclassified Helicobacter TaxID=2593540 RepID=UPI000E1F8F76|nr:MULTISPECIES: hypothetical protein [unclassified Helicobacter]RDU53343.1 hypothetical protein CQA49_06765 [Helicobacter sp. MIT 00-7814]RDU54164.1 hypothetical protein CQA37_06005 [Helicobacter sp. MIT 99-10781]